MFWKNRTLYVFFMLLAGTLIMRLFRSFLIIRAEDSNDSQLLQLSSSPVLASLIYFVAYSYFTPNTHGLNHLQITWLALAHAPIIQSKLYEYGSTDNTSVSSVYKKKKHRNSSPKPKDDAFNMSMILECLLNCLSCQNLLIILNSLK